MAKMRRFEMQIPVELEEALEAGRGFDSRSGFARRILLGAFGLDDGAVSAVEAGPAGPVTSGAPVPADHVTAAPRAAGGSRVHGSPALERFGGKS